MTTKVINELPIIYNTNNYNIDFKLIFGEGKDSAIYPDESERKTFHSNYDIEVFESNELKGYRVIANDAPVVIKISDIKIDNYNENNYDYALGFAVDNQEPEYFNEKDTTPFNIERDGTLWTIPANSNRSFKFDQNPNAKFQWMVKEALSLDYVPTEVEKELGLEQTTNNTGVIYITFMIYKKLKIENIEEPCRSKGATRSITRGATRGGDSKPARFGYGNEASSSSKRSEFIYAEGSERYVLPIRFRINELSKKNNINCSQTIKGASLSTLRKQTMVVPF